MAKGKTTCRILKEIRRQIAEANDIEYVVEECQYKGDCKGTCPKCEAEVRYLESQLHKRQMLGKAVVVAGLSLGVIPAMAQNIQNTDDVVTKSSICLSDTVINAKNTPSGKYIIRGKVVDRLDVRQRRTLDCHLRTPGGEGDGRRLERRAVRERGGDRRSDDGVRACAGNDAR